MKQKWFLKTWLICILFAFWWAYGIPLIIGIVLLVLKLKEDKKYTLNYSEMQKDFEHLSSIMTPEMNDAFTLRKIVDDLINQKSNLENELNQIKTTILDLEFEIKKKQNLIISMDDEVLVQEFGLYKPKYDFLNADKYKEALTTIRSKQKEYIKSGEATTGNMGWTVNGNKAQGNKMVKDMQKLLLRAFNSECDELIAKVKYNNFDASLKRITTSFDAISKLGTVMNISITRKYYNAKVEELQLALEYQLKKQEEKEALKEAREQLREAAKLQKELDEQRRKIEKEQNHYQNALLNIIKQIETAPEDKKFELLSKKAELESNLENIDNALKEVDYREANQKAGYVYIISNIGAFGENIFKIGMTRRLDPQERVDELGDASVPFNFDVHAMIFSEDAPKLEAALHKAFEDKKLNMINQRREFFKVTLNEIKEVVSKNFDKTVEYIEVPDAEQYRLSLKMKQAG
ncbi:DUF4041 domain-containing protein [Anaerocolumna jejuensis]|uniref:DUF4041 domain-containing protein n=1 Tax=Anaerocolumna jejuensis TaxID=259063 RepID=UPI003F7C606F